MHDERRVDYTVTEGIARIRLARVEAQNALDLPMVAALGAAVEASAKDPNVRVVLISAEGPTFTVGGDLAHLAARTRDLDVALEEMVPDYHRALMRLAGLEVPVVTAVQGAVAGGGLGLVCVADLVLAAESTAFTVGFARLGLSGDGGTTWFLPRLVGLRRAQELTIGGRVLKAAEAMAWGLVTRVVPDGQLASEAEAVAASLAFGATVAFGQIRRLLRDGWSATLEQHLRAEGAAMTRCARTDDAREGVVAFVEHRPPRFTGKEGRR